MLPHEFRDARNKDPNQRYQVPRNATDLAQYGTRDIAREPIRAPDNKADKRDNHREASTPQPRLRPLFFLLGLFLFLPLLGKAFRAIFSACARTLSTL